MTTPRQTIACAVALTAWLALPGVAPAQTSGDDSLDRLLQKLEQESKPADAPDVARTPKPGAVGDGDQSLDRLLEKLGGGGDDKPAPTGRPAPGETGTPSPDDKPPTEQLEGDEKTLDEHLEELLGRRRRSQDDQKGGGGENSPLAEAIRKMEEVRKRLSDTDTGDETRRKQGEVVTELERILEQIRQAQGQGQGQGQRMSRQTQQAGLRPGEQPGQNPQSEGNNARGAGPMQPLRPTVEEALANRKDIWGDLPPQLREEMDNIFKEEMLPAKKALIIRYFTSVAEKGQSGGPQ